MSIKDVHLQRLSAALKEIQCICTESIALTSDNPCVQKVCHCLDRVFLDGLRTPSRGYWDLLVELSHKQIIREIKSSSYLLTNHGRARAWLFHALSESLLESYLASLSGDVALLRRFYEPHAILADANRTRLLQTLLAGLEHCDLSCVSWATVTFLDVGCLDPAKRDRQRADTGSGSSGSLSAVLQDAGPAALPSADNPALLSSTGSHEQLQPSPPTTMTLTQDVEAQPDDLCSQDFNSIAMSQDDSLVVERKLTHRQKLTGGRSSNYYHLTVADSDDDASFPAAAVSASAPAPVDPPADSSPPSQQSADAGAELVGTDQPVEPPVAVKVNGDVRPSRKQRRQQPLSLPPPSLPLPMSMPMAMSSRRSGESVSLARSLADELLEAEAAIRGDADADVCVYKTTDADADVYKSTDADADVYKSTDAEADVYKSTDADADVYKSTDADADVYKSTDAEADVYKSTDAEADVYKSTDAEADVYKSTDADADVYKSTDADVYGNGDADADADADVHNNADADTKPGAGSVGAEVDANQDELSSSGASDEDAADSPNPFEPSALSSDYALPLRQVQDTLGDSSISAAYRALWWRGDAWAACLLCLSPGRVALVSSGSLSRLCEWRPDSLDHVCQSGQAHLLHMVGVARANRHFVACVDQSIGESAARDIRRCLPTVPLFRGSPCQEVGLGKWLRVGAPDLAGGAPLHYALVTHEALLDARLPVRPPRGDWIRRRLLLSGGWLLAAPGSGGPQWSLAGCRGCRLVQDSGSNNGEAVVEVTLAGSDSVLIGGPSSVIWKQAICSAMTRGSAGGGATSKVLTLLVTEQGLALGAEVPGVWTVETVDLVALEEVRSIGYDPHYPTYLTLRLRPPTTWLLCLGSAEERNRLGRLLRHLLPRLPLRRLAASRAGGLRASARALTLLCEQTLS